MSIVDKFFDIYNINIICRILGSCWTQKTQLSGIFVQKAHKMRRPKVAEYERTLALKSFNRGTKYLGIIISGYNQVMYATLHSQSHQNPRF